MITLKEHNVKPYAQLCEMLAIHQKCAYIAATGTGKSYVVGKYIEDHDLMNKTLVLVPSKAIKDAWEKLLPGLAVITYQSLLKGENDFSWAVLIVCDEMHHLGAAEWGRVYQNAIQKINCKLVGITATPIRFLDQGRNMAEEYFDSNYVEGLDLPGAISAGILPSFDYITALFDLPSRRPSEKGRNEYTERLFQRLDFMSSEYSFKNILKKHLDAGNHKIAVFANRIEDIAMIKNLILEVYPKAKHFEVHSGRKKQAKQTLAAFAASTDMSFVYTVDMLNEGIHIKNVDCIIMFRKTESPIVYLQQMGRALGNDMVGHRIKIFDFVANHRNLKAVKGGSGTVIDWIQRGISNPQHQIAVSDYTIEELQLLDKLMQVINGVWTPEEDDVLRDLYSAGKGPSDVSKALPYRSINAISNRAYKLELTRMIPSYEYSDEYYQDIKMLYPTENGLDILAAKYPQYPRTLIVQHANKMGLRKQRYTEWTEEMDQILFSNADKGIDYLKSLFPDISERCIAHRREKLGLVKKKVNYWTEERDALLGANLEKTAKELQEEFFPDATITMINKRRHNKFHSSGRRNSWSKENKELFIAAYKKGGTKEVKKHPEFKECSSAFVKASARQFKITNSSYVGRWTDEEIKIIEDQLALKECDQEPIAVIAKKLPRRTFSSIKQKRAQLAKKRKEAEANGTDTEPTDTTENKAEA